MRANIYISFDTNKFHIHSWVVLFLMVIIITDKHANRLCKNSYNVHIYDCIPQLYNHTKPISLFGQMIANVNDDNDDNGVSGGDYNDDNNKNKQLPITERCRCLTTTTISHVESIFMGYPHYESWASLYCQSVQRSCRPGSFSAQIAVMWLSTFMSCPLHDPWATSPNSLHRLAIMQAASSWISSTWPMGHQELLCTDWQICGEHFHEIPYSWLVAPLDRLAVGKYLQEISPSWTMHHRAADHGKLDNPICLHKHSITDGVHGHNGQFVAGIKFVIPLKVKLPSGDKWDGGW